MPRALAVHVLFGRPGQLFGFLFLIFSLVVGTVFASSSEPLIGPSYDRDALGTIVRVEDSGAAAGNDVIYAVDATFIDERNIPRRVRSYTTSAVVVGGNVTVRYERSDPEQAVIDGMRTHEFGWWTAYFMLTFIGGGLWCIFRGFRRSLRALRVLRTGRVAAGTTLEVKEESDDEGSLWVGTFEFTTVDGRSERCEATTNGSGGFVVGAPEPIIYDPGWPDHAEPLRHLPGAPAIVDDQTVTSGAHPLRLVLVVGMMFATVITAIGAAAITLASWL